MMAFPGRAAGAAENESRTLAVALAARLLALAAAPAPRSGEECRIFGRLEPLEQHPAVSEMTDMLARPPCEA